MYGNIPKTGDLLIAGGVFGILAKSIWVFVAFGILFTLLSLREKRIALEPVHHPDGKYHLALTKNGKPIRWFRRNRVK